MAKYNVGTKWKDRKNIVWEYRNKKLLVVEAKSEKELIDRLVEQRYFSRNMVRVRKARKS